MKITVGRAQVALWGCIAAATSGSLLANVAFAQQLYFYPASGQTTAQQQQDQFQCSSWAAQQTGFNPNVPPPLVPTTPPDVGGPLLFGRIHRAQLLQEEDAAAQQQLAAYNQGMSAFNRAMSACMRGRGYGVD